MPKYIKAEEGPDRSVIYTDEAKSRLGQNKILQLLASNIQLA